MRACGELACYCAEPGAPRANIKWPVVSRALDDPTEGSPPIRAVPHCRADLRAVLESPPADAATTLAVRGDGGCSILRCFASRPNCSSCPVPILPAGLVRCLVLLLMVLCRMGGLRVWITPFMACPVHVPCAACLRGVLQLRDLWLVLCGTSRPRTGTCSMSTGGAVRAGSSDEDAGCCCAVLASRGP